MEFKKIICLAKDVLLAKIFNRKIPFRVKHRITYKCNLDCPFCLLKNQLNKPNSFEMSAPQIKKMMREFKKIGTKFWLFCGGEPLLREDLGELISYAKDEMDFHCSMTTNGTLLIDKLKNSPSFKRLDLIQLSVDGPKEIQDKLRGIGTYEKNISALEILRKLQIKTTILVLITKDNINHLDCLIRLANHYNANIFFQTAGVQPKGPAELKENFFPGKEIFKKTIEELIKKRRTNRSILSSLSYLKMLKDCWPDVAHKIKCYAGRFYCDITPEGFVVPCCTKSNRANTSCQGLNIGFQNAFLHLDNMSDCRDCYYAGPQELNIAWGMIPVKLIALYREYF